MKRIDNRILLVAITFAGFALRIIQLDFQPLWWDEGYSLFFATRDFATLVVRTAVDIHPPLYYVLLKAWMAFAGQSEVAVRFLSVAIGVAAIPLLYLLAIKLFDNRRVALITALLLAFSPLHIFYSQEVRMYGLVTLFSLVSVLFLVQLLNMPQGKPKTALVALAYIFVTAAALYTQYYAAFILAFEMFFVATRPLVPASLPADEPPDNSYIRSLRVRTLRTARALRHWIAAWAAILALYVPWLAYAGGKLFSYITAKKAIEQYVPLDPFTFLAQHIAAFSTGHLSELTSLAWGSLLLVGVGILGVFVMWGRHDRSGLDSSLPSRESTSWLISLYLTVPLLGGYLVNLIYPFHPVRNERLLLLAMPAFLIIVALGIDTLWNRRRWVGAIALVAIAVISVASLYDFYLVPRYPDDDYRPLISQIQQLAQPGDTFLAIYPWQIGYLESYYTAAPLDVLETPSDTWINNPVQMQRDLDTRMAQVPRIWVPAFQAQGHILEDALDANLRPRTYSILDTWFGTTRLELFQRADDPTQADHPLQFTLDGQPVSLDKWGVSTGPITAGQDILRFWINGPDTAIGTLKMSTRLVDSKHDVWAQDDREIAAGLQRIGFSTPVGMPPGDYDLLVALYHNQATPSETELVTHIHIVAPAQPILAAVPHHSSIEFNQVRLVGFEAPPLIQPGEGAPVTLYWQALSALDVDYRVGLQVQDNLGNVYADVQTPPALGIYPTTRWQPNELVRDPQTITLGSDTPDGEYKLVAKLIDPAQSLTSSTHVVGTIAVKGRPHYFGAPSPLQALDTRFGDVARLVGYDLSSEGPTVRLVLYWQALKSTPISYKVFAHIVDSTGNIIAQSDQFPGMGVFPTTSWVSGEYLVDLHGITIPQSSDYTGTYQVRIGMYDPATGIRLESSKAADNTLGDYLLLPTSLGATP